MRYATTILTFLAAAGFTAGCEDGTGPDIDAQSAQALNAVYTQSDRFGLPAIATVFIPASQKDAYNEAQPSGDVATYTDEVVDVLTTFGHPNPAALAAAVLPDAQPINTTMASGFLNGRWLEDDVITAELMLIFGSNAALNDDHVDANDKPFLPVFPYLADPHLQ